MSKHYAFSDIHGNYNLFRQIKSFLQPDDVCFVLGDCVDRGKDGYAIIKEIMQDKRFVCLKGNLEELFALSVLTRQPEHIQCWLQNGGRPTFDAFVKGSPTIKWIEKLSKLPMFVEYKNADEITYIMSHSGFDYNSPETARNYTEDREHYRKFNEIPDKTVLIHGHTPFQYLPAIGVKGEYLKCNNCKQKVFYSYNDGHKIDIDCGTDKSKFIALYCFDDYTVYGFEEREKMNEQRSQMAQRA